MTSSKKQQLTTTNERQQQQRATATIETTSATFNWDALQAKCEWVREG